MIFACGEFSQLTCTGQRRLEGSTREGRKEAASRAVMATIFELSFVWPKLRDCIFSLSNCVEQSRGIANLNFKWQALPLVRCEKHCVVMHIILG
jgi:hypothetical protein